MGVCPRWLWNRATGPKASGVITAPAVRRSAEAWAREVHAKYLAPENVAASPSGADAMAPPATTIVGNEVLTNLANALALQVTDRASSAAAVTKKGLKPSP